MRIINADLSEELQRMLLATTFHAYNAGELEDACRQLGIDMKTYWYYDMHVLPFQFRGSKDTLINAMVDAYLRQARQSEA